MLTRFELEKRACTERPDPQKDNNKWSRWQRARKALGMPWRVEQIKNRVGTGRATHERVH